MHRILTYVAITRKNKTKTKTKRKTRQKRLKANMTNGQIKNKLKFFWFLLLIHYCIIGLSTQSL